MNVVVVEAPAKAKTINKYLGSDYIVLASYGHIRDLPSKDGSVKPDEDFAMDYKVSSDSKKHVKAIADAIPKNKILFLYLWSLLKKLIISFSTIYYNQYKFKFINSHSHNLISNNGII